MRFEYEEDRDRIAVTINDGLTTIEHHIQVGDLGDIESRIRRAKWKSGLISEEEYFSGLEEDRTER